MSCSAVSAHKRAALDWTETITRVIEASVPEKALESSCKIFEEKALVDFTIAGKKELSQ